MTRLRGRFESLYGGGALHLLSAVASFALTAYVLTRIFDEAEPVNILIWLGGAILLHDFFLFPITAALNALAIRRHRGPEPGRLAALNHVRVPAFFAGLALIVWFPLILGLGAEDYERATGQTTSAYLGRWLLFTAAAFGISALLYAIRLRRARSAEAETR